MTEKEILEIIKKHPEVILEIIYSSSVATKQDIKILYRKLSLNLEKKLEESKTKIEKALENKLEEKIFQIEKALENRLEEKRLEIEKTIKIEIEKIISQFQLEIEKLRAESNERMSQMENQFRLEIEKLRAEMEIKLQAMKNSLLKWIIGLILAQTLTIVLTILMAVALK
jgi:flagellar biosynthesis/type III secretory pathway protein FliH